MSRKKRLEKVPEPFNPAPKLPPAVKSNGRPVLNGSGILGEIFDQITTNIAYLDRQARILHANAAFQRTVGKTAAELAGINGFDLYPSENGQALYAQVLESGQPYSTYDIPYPDPNHPGQVTYWDWTLQPVLGQNGQVEGVIFTSIEVTRRKRAQQALAQTQALFELLFESAPDANVLVAESGEILAVNRRTEEMLGFQRGELTGQPIESLMPQRYAVSHPHLRGHYNRNPRIRHMAPDLDLTARHKDGHEIPVNVTLSPLRTEQGLLILSVIRDVTSRKEAEDALRRQEAELHEVQHRLLRKAEDERAFLARELHDGPIQELYHMAFQLDELASGSLPAGQEELIQQTRESLQTTITTLRSIMSELRPPTLAPFGLEKTIRSHAEQFANSHPELAVDLDLDSDGQSLPEMLRLALFRIYQEALNNTLRHAQADRVQVTFRYHLEQVELSVSDNGRGFVVPRQWVNLARKGHYGLVGMRERAEALGGQLEVISAPGEGTRYTVRVPLQQLTEG